MEIENEFIPYEQSLALKELGFDEPCFRGWDENTKIWFHPDSDIITDNPTFSQAFRFFRERYNLEANPMIVIQGKEKWYNLSIINPLENGFSIDNEYKRIRSFDEAQLECLKKLIEIVKNQ